MAKRFLLILLSIIIILPSCLVVKEKEYSDVEQTISLSPKPEIPMSEKLVRSKKGDMISFIPEEWFFVNVNEDASSDIIIMAVNPDYTLGVVFSEIRKNDLVDGIVRKEGLLGLARLSMDRRARKTGGASKLLGKYTPVEMGSNDFVKYEFSSAGNMRSIAVVFKSSLDMYYEMTMMPMSFSGKKLPPYDEINKILRSVMATVKF